MGVATKTSARSGAAGRRWAATITAALVAGLLGLTAPAASAADVTVPDDRGGFDVVGRGWGHGRGMSQWGAQGAALQGRTARQVLDFYYPGSSLDAVPRGPIRVKIAEEDNDLVARASADLRVTDRATGVVINWSGLGSRARVVRAADGFLRVQYQSGGSWVDVQNPQWPGNRVTGPVVLSGPPTTWLSLPGGLEREYRGTMAAHRTATAMDVVNTLGSEEYLYGVVPRESPSFFAPAALQAQAVAARSYAFSNCSAGAAHYDVLNTTTCQVYNGRTLLQGGRVTAMESPQTTAAVDATRDLVLRRGGTVLRAEFSSSNGGWTVASNGWPAQADPFDGVDPRNTNHTWTARLTAEQVARAWPQVGAPRSVEVTSRTGQGELGGRALSVRVSGSAGRVDVTGEQFRTGLGLRSSWFALSGGTAGRTSGDVVVVDTGTSTTVTSVATTSSQPFVTEAVQSRLGATNPAQWRFFAHGDGTAARPDLVSVRTSGTGSGRVEVHTLTGASNYQTFSVHAATPLPAVPDGGDWVFGVASFAGSGKPDLFAIRTRGGSSGRLEVHVLSAASGYKTWVSQKATAFGELQPGTMDLIVGDAGQQGALTAVVYGGSTGSGMAEIHRLTAGSGYKTFDLHAATALHLSASNTFSFAWGDYDRDGTYELYAVKLQGTGTGNVEVHVLDDDRKFTTWSAHRATSVPARPGTRAAVRMW